MQRTSDDPWRRHTDRTNATYSFKLVHCSTRDCSGRRLISDDGGFYDLFLYPMPLRRGVQLEDYVVQSLTSTKQGVIAPRGRQLKISELFLAPFETEVWITIVVLLVSCILLSLLMPNQFHNELVLLVLCSFERTALYRVKRLERTVTITLIIFFCILLSAYESLFISMMTNQPRALDPRTLDDLLEAEVKIEIPLAITNIPQLELHPLIRNVSRIKTDRLDGVSAYTDTQERLKFMMKHPKNYDFEKGQSKYVMLEWSSWSSLEFFMFSPKNPLIPKFAFLQTVLEESGIFRKLEDQAEYEYFGTNARHHQVMLRRFVSSDVVSDLENLRPVWLVLCLGLLIGAIGWMAEWGWFLGNKLYNRIVF